ncbi:MAG: HIT family protein [Nitrososphaera sp.]
MGDPECIFCRIVSGEIPAKVIMQNELAVALLDAFPLAVGHSLVTTRSHRSKVQDLKSEETIALFEMTKKIAAAVEAAMQAAATTIAIHNGREAGQEIPHVHVHVIPRRRGDGAGPVHSMFKNRPKLSPQEFDSVHGKITASLAKH